MDFLFVSIKKMEMKRFFLLAISILFFSPFHSTANDSIPAGAKAILKAYPQTVISYKNNRLYFKDGSSIIYDDSIENKNYKNLVDHPSVKNQFVYTYTKGSAPKSIPYLFDPGRIRNEDFFKKMYGATSYAVQKNLVEIIWCPALLNKKIKVTKINGADKALQKVSQELDKHPELKVFLQDIGGTFNWRPIKGTQRLSTHSYGIAIDINTNKSDYWQWNCKCANEENKMIYSNKIPQIIIDIFEKNGFIWGGKWYHYDTMHFEYRPELLQ